MASGTPACDRAGRGCRARILTYHKIGRKLELAIPAVSRKRFAAHLDILLSLARPLVSAREAALGAEADAVAVTFDDGYRSVYGDAFPEMAARGLAGTIFPVVGSIGGRNTWDVRLSLRRFMHLSWAELDELARYGFEIGSHTMSHRDLTRLSREDLATELAGSKKLLEDRLGREVVSVAYPFGKAGQRVAEAAALAGYKCGFVSLPRVAGGAPGASMMIGRMSVYGIDGRASLLAKLGVVPGYRFEAFKCRMIARLSHGTPAVKR